MDCQIDDFLSRVIGWEQFTFFDGFADHAIQRFNGVGGVNHLSDISRIIEQGIEVMCNPPSTIKSVYPEY